LGLAGCLWSLNSGQDDDLDGAAWRTIMDDKQPMNRSGMGRD
jgi:cbb3-type cytochrome oxidase maturation protein